MKKLLISHVDLDGIAGIILAQRYNKHLGFDEILSEDYGFETKEGMMEFLEGFDEIIFADMSIPEAVYDDLIEKGIKIKVFDHHETAKWIQDKSPESVWDHTRSGTQIFWEEYIRPHLDRYNPILDEFVTLVSTYDLWKTDSPLWETAKNLNNILYSMRDYTEGLPFNEAHKKFLENTRKKLVFSTRWGFTLEENRYIRKANYSENMSFNEGMSKLSIRYDSKGRMFGVTALKSKISIVASRILNEIEELEYLVIVNLWNGMDGKISFRSRGFNCLELGAPRGHKQACACKILPEQAKNLLLDQTLAFTYKDEYLEEDPETHLHKVG